MGWVQGVIFYGAGFFVQGGRFTCGVASRSSGGVGGRELVFGAWMGVVLEAFFAGEVGVEVAGASEGGFGDEEKDEGEDRAGENSNEVK